MFFAEAAISAETAEMTIMSIMVIVAAFITLLIIAGGSGLGANEEEADETDKAGLMTPNEYERFVQEEIAIFGQPLPKHAEPDEQDDNGKTSWTITQ